MKTGTVTLLGIYDHTTELGFHVQVKDCSSAVLLSEIEHVVAPGKHIISDSMCSYHRLPERGYDHSLVVHDKEFVSSSDTSIHTQNTEIRNRWTKAAVRSYRKNRPLNSYAVKYSYRLLQGFCLGDVK